MRFSIFDADFDAGPEPKVMAPTASTSNQQPRAFPEFEDGAIFVRVVVRVLCDVYTITNNVSVLFLIQTLTTIKMKTLPMEKRRAGTRLLPITSA